MHIAIKIMPMGESINEATICSFLAAQHSYVTIDQEIVELETGKANQILYASTSGTIHWTAQEGKTVKIGGQIGYIDTTPSMQKNTLSTPPSSLSPCLEKKLCPNAQETRLPFSPLRKAMAEHLLQAQKSMATVTTFNEVDMTAVINMRMQAQETFTKKYGTRLGLLPFFIQAAVEALQKFPILNTTIENAEIVYHNSFDIGVAISSEKGLVVPILRSCDTLSFSQMQEQITHFSEKAKEGKLSIGDIQGGSFTISNGGVYGSMLSTPIVHAPQNAILGMHKITKRAVVIEESIVVRSMMYLALSYNHCYIDGREAISFLSHLKHTIENPSPSSLL